MKLVLLFLLASAVLPSFSQYDSSSTYLTIGKAKHRILSRKISEDHIGITRLAFTPIWYVTNGQKKYRKIGLGGRNIANYLLHDSRTLAPFMLFKKQKMQSYLCLSAACVSYFAWAAIGIREALSNQPNAFISYKSLPFFGSFSYFVFRGIRLNTRADISLVLSVRAFNRINRH